MPSLPLIQDLNDGQYGQFCYLRPSSVTLIMTGLDWLQKLYTWQGANGYNLTTDEQDDVEDMLAQLSEDIFMPLVGMIFAIAGDCPDFCLECDGSTYDRLDYPRLYSVLDPVYHIDADTFRVPSLSGQVQVGLGTSPDGNTYAMDDAAGNDAITLTTAQMPSHSHTDVGHTHAEAIAAPGVAQVGAGVSAVPGVGVTGVGNANLTSTGGDGAHENRQPTRALRMVIVAL